MKTRQKEFYNYLPWLLFNLVTQFIKKIAILT